jgi:hypothetical protein
VETGAGRIVVVAIGLAGDFRIAVVRRAEEGCAERQIVGQRHVPAPSAFTVL